MNDSQRHRFLREIFCSPALILATWLGSGLSPWMPGTIGSLAALPFIWLLLEFVMPVVVLFIALILLLLGVWSANIAGRQWGKTDHGAIVIDEVVGQLLAIAIPFYVFAGSVNNLMLYGVGLLTFRFFDIVKPWPACWFDRCLKNGWGVMLDDVAAGIWSAVVTILVVIIF